jgi:hypothetical protein
LQEATWLLCLNPFPVRSAKVLDENAKAMSVTLVAVLAKFQWI